MPKHAERLDDQPGSSGLAEIRPDPPLRGITTIRGAPLASAQLGDAFLVMKVVETAPDLFFGGKPVAHLLSDLSDGGFAHLLLLCRLSR